MKDRKISRWLGRSAIALALTAIAAPVAQARHASGEAGLGTSSVGRIDAATRHHHPDVVAPRTRIVAVARADGFDWGDAGIGAGGALGAALLVSGSALLLKRNNRRAITARLQS
jgi:hypothetical protein